MYKLTGVRLCSFDLCDGVGAQCSVGEESANKVHEFLNLEVY